MKNNTVFFFSAERRGKRREDIGMSQPGRGKELATDLSLGQCESPIIPTVALSRSFGRFGRQVITCLALAIIMLGLVIAHILLDIYVLSDSGQSVAFIPLAALIGLGAAGSIWQGQQNRQNIKDQLAGNMQLAQYAYSKDLEMWNRQNQYNTPQMQMKRYMEAGLNPNMIYGQGSPGNATQLPKFNAPSVDYSSRGPAFDFGKVVDAMQMHQNFEVQRAQIDNVRAQQKNTEMRTISEATRNAMMSVSMRLKEEEIKKLQLLTPAQRASLDAGVRKLDADTARSRWDVERGRTLLPYQAEVAKGQAGAAKYAVDSAFQNLINLRQQFSQMLKTQEKTEAETEGVRRQNLIKGQVLRQKDWEQQIRDKYGINPTETLMGLISKALAEGASQWSK